MFFFVPLLGCFFARITKSNPLSNPKGVHFGAFWYTRSGKKNAQNVGFEHFGTFWYPRYAEREEYEPKTLTH